MQASLVVKVYDRIDRRHTVKFSSAELTALPYVISAPRFATYLKARLNHTEDALRLYVWNLQISAAFMVPLQLCEVATRNGIVEAVEKVHGSTWPWRNGFIRSLPTPKKPHQYNAQLNLKIVAAQQPTAGKVVAELNYAFWQRIMTSGQDKRLWEPHLRDAFPGAPTIRSIAEIRASMYGNLEEIRRFRNRIAHHEPIFNRILEKDLARLRGMLAYRSLDAAQWLDNNEAVTSLIAARP